MPKIVERKFYNGAKLLISRLGLASLIQETENCVTDFDLKILDRRNANSGAVLRELIDWKFKKSPLDWQKRQTGGVDWTLCKKINGARLCIGVEVQVSARSDLIIRDLVHLRDQLESGALDLGILVLPSKELSYRLTDRAPAFEDGVRIVQEMRVDYLPLLLIAIEYDGFSGVALPKKRTRQGRDPSSI